MLHNQGEKFQASSLPLKKRPVFEGKTKAIQGENAILKDFSVQTT